MHAFSAVTDIIYLARVCLRAIKDSTLCNYGNQMLVLKNILTYSGIAKHAMVYYSILITHLSSYTSIDTTLLPTAKMAARRFVVLKNRYVLF